MRFSMRIEKTAFVMHTTHQTEETITV